MSSDGTASTGEKCQQAYNNLWTKSPLTAKYC